MDTVASSCSAEDLKQLWGAYQHPVTPIPHPVSVQCEISLHFSHDKTGNKWNH